MPAHHADVRLRRGARLLAAVAGMTLCAGLVGGMPRGAGLLSATADPRYPSQDQVNRARQAAAAAAADVKRIQAQLAAASAAADRAALAESVADERYNAAQLSLARARSDARTAAATADLAASRLTGARRQVGQLAAQEYRDGGALSDLEVLFDSGGPQTVLDRAAMVHVIGAGRAAAVRAMDADRAAAVLLQRQAAQALEVQRQAAARTALARVEAQRQAGAAQALVARETAMQDQLTARLAAAQHTSVTLERQREAGIAAARAAAEAAAQQAALRRAGARGGWSVRGGTAAGRAVVAWAQRRIGLPYLWGGDGPASYDCSGLTMRAWQQVGVDLPHSAAEQYQVVTRIPYGALAPGDLIFYALDPGDPATIHHVAMYAGDGMMIEAPHTGADVREVPIRMGDGAMPYAGRP